MRKKPKRRERERPTKGRLIAVKLPENLVSALDDLLVEVSAETPWVPVTRSDVLRWLLDIALLRDEPRLAATAIRIARATAAKTRQNLALAFGYNVLAIPLAMAGLLSPAVAGAAMAASSISVVLNALTLRHAR